MVDNIYPLKQKSRRLAGVAIAQQGFTLLEVLIVVFMVGILAAIGTPSWLSMVNNTRINKAIAPVEQAIRQAQRNATQRKSTWRASFKEENNAIWWAVDSVPNDPATPPTNWEKIDEVGVKLDTTNTTLGDSSTPLSIQFDDKGNVINNDPGEQITLTLQSNPNKKRCVKVTTLLGSLRTAQNNECGS